MFGFKGCDVDQARMMMKTLPEQEVEAGVFGERDQVFHP